MTTQEILDILQRDIHSTVFATADGPGLRAGVGRCAFPAGKGKGTDQAETLAEQPGTHRRFRKERAAMTHGEQRIYLIQELLAEDARYRDISIPSDEQGQKDLLRSLMNVRMPKPISHDFLAIQDEYLQEERDMRGITESEKLPSISGNPRIALWQGDITTLKADAIVNAANSGMLGCFHPLHSCIDNIIGTMSGIQLRLYCHDMMRKQGHEEPTGQAKITPAFNLPSKYILHTVGPIIRGAVRKQDRAALASCYRSCLELAAEHGLASVAFCCISTGEFRFPNQEAAEIAVEIVQDFLRRNTSIQKVIFNVFKDLDAAIYRALLGPDGHAEASA